VISFTNLSTLIVLIEQKLNLNEVSPLTNVRAYNNRWQQKQFKGKHHEHKQLENTE